LNDPKIDTNNTKIRPNNAKKTIGTTWFDGLEEKMISLYAAKWFGIYFENKI
jgi:hypothetical protein